MDILWIVLGFVGCAVVFSIILSIASFSSERFMQKYEKFKNIAVKTDLNIQDFIYNLNHSHFNGKLKVSLADKEAGDFYSSKSKTVALSKTTLSSSTIASFAIVSHEMGHAKQDFEGNKLKLFNGLRFLGTIIGFLFLPLLLSALILLFWMDSFLIISIILASCAAFILLLAIIIKSITISIEKEASEKGLNFLKEILTQEELDMCRELLNAARLTYWGDLFRLLFAWTALTRKTNMFK